MAFCEKCIHKEVCYFSNNGMFYSIHFNCNSFLPKDEIRKESNYRSFISYFTGGDKRK